MIDNVPVFLALVDQEGRYILANENYAQNFQQNKKGIVGMTREEVLPPKIINDQKKYF